MEYFSRSLQKTLNSRCQALVPLVLELAALFTLQPVEAQYLTILLTSGASILFLSLKNTFFQPGTLDTLQVILRRLPAHGQLQKCSLMFVTLGGHPLYYIILNDEVTYKRMMFVS